MANDVDTHVSVLKCTIFVDESDESTAVVAVTPKFSQFTAGFIFLLESHESTLEY
jgi:hypothetical protein